MIRITLHMVFDSEVFTDQFNCNYSATDEDDAEILLFLSTLLFDNK